MRSLGSRHGGGSGRGCRRHHGQLADASNRTRGLWPAIVMMSSLPEDAVAIGGRQSDAISKGSNMGTIRARGRMAWCFSVPVRPRRRGCRRVASDRGGRAGRRRAPRQGISGVSCVPLKSRSTHQRARLRSKATLQLLKELITEGATMGRLNQGVNQMGGAYRIEACST